MGSISPGGRGDSDQVVTEVDEGINVLPLVEIVVIEITGGEQGLNVHNHIETERTGLTTVQES